MCYANDQAWGVKKEHYCEILPVVIVDYNYDSLGRRTNVSNSGTAFSSAKFNEFGYNDRSELTASNRYTGNLGDTSNPVADEHRLYDYDPIGNRKEAIEGNNAIKLTYTANQLNQYTLITSDVGWAAPTTYDDDGNLISASPDSGIGLVGCAARTVFDYDAENRLISVAPETPVDGATKVEYVYDYMSRRAQKKVSTYSSGSWSLTSSTSFIYDGWNLIREITSDPSPVTSYYIWGLDLSGSLQGAGGIGGLLSRVKDGSAQSYTYDGNGNVSELLNHDGSIAAHYEYDPYGNLIAGSGDNPFRFSTKYLDAETGLYYYGFRFYSPVMGRWLNRDPLEEPGGINVYSFCLNNPLLYFDATGLAVGHHYFPGEVWRELPLPADVYKYFEKATTFALPGGHGWSEAHKKYNQAVKNLWGCYVKENNICIPNMTIEQAEGFLKKINSSKAQDIKGFLKSLPIQQGGRISVKYLEKLKLRIKTVGVITGFIVLIEVAAGNDARAAVWDAINPLSILESSQIGCGEGETCNTDFQ